MDGTASAVSISRITARKHFPSDVVVGGVLGWLVGREVYNRHHDHDLAGRRRDLGVVEPGRLADRHLFPLFHFGHGSGVGLAE